MCHVIERRIVTVETETKNAMSSYLDPIAQNVEGVRQLVGSRLNKTNGALSDSFEGVEDEQIDELDLSMDEKELLALAHTWEGKYRTYEASIKLRQEAQKTFYLGRQKEGSPAAQADGQSISANLLFEAEETFLPAALSKNPEPVVWTDNTDEGSALANDVKTMLQYHADTLVLRRKLTLMTRHWSIYFLGAMKHGWDERLDDIKTEVVDPTSLILDPEASIDCYGDYEGAYLGERKTTTAQKLIDLFPKHKAYITVLVDGKLGTPVTYTEWWNDDYTFTTFKDQVLDKSKNPHFKYPKMVMQTDEFGNSEETEEKGVNHFAFPKKPYTFLSVFSLGDQPHDITGLIEQNIPNQRRVSRRTDQIDYNLSRANNSDVFSEENFNQETATQAARAMAAGRPVLIPQGKSINEAIARLQAPTIGSDFFTELQNSKQDLRSIFGTEGISSQPANEDTTARGMILNQQFDNTRIGGGIGDALEQVADNVFNWWVQLYAVYYDEPHFAAVMGQMKAVEYITLTSNDLDRRIVVSVAPDSMKPHDELTEMNQAMSLWEAGALDPKTLLTMLNVPDAQTTAESTVLWLLDKNAYMQLNFPEVAQQLQQIQDQQQAQMQAQGGMPGAQPGAAQAPPGGQEAPAPPPTLGEAPASASLQNVPLPT